MRYTEEFERWWASYWKPYDTCGAMNDAFKEIAFQAWVAAMALQY